MLSSVGLTSCVLIFPALFPAFPLVLPHLGFRFGKLFWLPHVSFQRPDIAKRRVVQRSFLRRSRTQVMLQCALLFTQLTGPPARSFSTTPDGAVDEGAITANF